MSNLNEEATPTEAYRLPTPRLDDALTDLEKEITRGVNQHLLEECTHKATIRVQKREAIYRDTVRLGGFGLGSDLRILCLRCPLSLTLRRNQQHM